MGMLEDLGGSPPVNSSSVNALSLFASVIISLYNTPPESSPVRVEDSYDFVIVGAGAAGCVLANRLSEISHWRILLLEAGDEEPDASQVPAFYSYAFASKINWKYWTEPQAATCGGYPCPYPSGKVLGGTTSINGMVYNRGSRHIYDKWAKMGNTGWSYSEVLPYFKKSEDNRDPEYANNTLYHGTGGYLSVQKFPYQDVNTVALLQALRELGYSEVDVNGMSQYGYMLQQSTTRDGARQSTNTAFLQPVRYKRSNLQVVTNAHVTKVLIDPNTKKTLGVEYVFSNGKNRTTICVNATKEVILSAGVFKSPQILQLSGVGPGDLLKSLNISVIQNLSVGYNLADHVEGGSSLRVVLNKSVQMPENLEEIISSYAEYAGFQNGPFSSLGVSQLIVYANSIINTETNIPDLQLLFSPNQNLKEYWKLPFCYYNEFYVLVINVATKSRGHVLINSTDPFSSPEMRFNYMSEKEDLERLVDGMYIVYNISQTKALRDLGISLGEDPSCAHLGMVTREYFRCLLTGKTATAFHATGTCKMGPTSDSGAVVDPQLKVHGITGLRVIDASIIPEPVNSNTQVPTIMIAEKGADLIKEDWLHPISGKENGYCPAPFRYY